MIVKNKQMLKPYSEFERIIAELKTLKENESLTCMIVEHSVFLRGRAWAKEKYHGEKIDILLVNFKDSMAIEDGMDTLRYFDRTNIDETTIEHIKKMKYVDRERVY